MLPATESHIQKKLGKFRDFLSARGAELLEPTNPFEVLRFRANGRVSIIYKNGAGTLNYQAEAADAFLAFKEGRTWNAVARTNRPKKKPVLIRTLLARDGSSCFYCGYAIRDGEETLEHMVPIAHGGTNHLSNCALAHNACNLNAGHLSVVEKVKLRERMRATTRTERTT